MKFEDLFATKNSLLTSEQAYKIRTQCSEFLSLTKHPLLKNLSNKTENFLRVKVRFHKRNNDFIEIFNQALGKKFNVFNIHQRAIFANGIQSFVFQQDLTPYYIFPINGFKFFYNKQIKNSNNEYIETFETLAEQFEHSKQPVISIVKDLIEYTYVSENLEQGIVDGCEIVIYNIPYYYAIKYEAIPNYSEFIEAIKG